MAELPKNLIVLNRDGLSNFHTHSTYCDGNDTIFEMAEAAYNLGFTELGFSGHEYSEPDASYAMTPAQNEEYIKDILAVRESYAGKMNIYLGIERDYFCEPDETTYAYDYIIGSVHHVKVNGVYYDVDHSRENFEESLEKGFQGDAMRFVSAYFKTVSDVLRKTGGQVVGHFDLVRKFNEGNRYFDENSAEYQELALAAARKIIADYRADFSTKTLPANLPPTWREQLEKGNPIFEINTGAMAKGYRENPYPAMHILEELAKEGIPVIFNSDCHDKNKLTYGFSALLDGTVKF